jgi:hypothetical protein
VDISVKSWSSNACGSEAIVVVIGGFSDRMILYNDQLDVWYYT